MHGNDLRGHARVSFSVDGQSQKGIEDCRVLVDLSILDSYLELDLDSILAPCIVSVGTPIRPAREQREGCLPQFLTPLFLFSQ
jgi:hypothetical protein